MEIYEAKFCILIGLMMVTGRSGEAQVMSDGSGMFMGSVQLPTMGTWWVRLNAQNG